MKSKSSVAVVFSFLVGIRTYQHPCRILKNEDSTGVLKSPWPDLLPDLFSLMVRILLLMLVLLYIETVLICLQL